MSMSLDDLIEAADLNGLLRAVDGLCERKAWEDLVEVADRCEEALERGKQLWPIATHIDYRLALEAPGDYAAGVVQPELSRFALGPLTEVAASTHSWAELAPYLESSQAAAYVAQERVLRGERLDSDNRAHPEVLDLPLHLEPWEPTYALATFRADHVEVAEPWDPRAPMEEQAPQEAQLIDDQELESTLLDLVAPWTAESNGAARVAITEGEALGAISCLAFDSIRIGPLETAEAIQRMAWAAASGGAHGRRRGAALGRFMSWYGAALMIGLPWPVEPDVLGDALGALRWFRWDEGQAEKGWVLRIAVEHPEDGWAAAIAATDLLEEDDEEA